MIGYMFAKGAFSSLPRAIIHRYILWTIKNDWAIASTLSYPQFIVWDGVIIIIIWHFTLKDEAGIILYF